MNSVVRKIVTLVVILSLSLPCVKASIVSLLSFKRDKQIESCEAPDDDALEDEKESDDQQEKTITSNAQLNLLHHFLNFRKFLYEFSTLNSPIFIPALPGPPPKNAA